MTAPTVLNVDLGAWFEFLTGIGLTKDQLVCILCQVGPSIQRLTMMCVQRGAAINPLLWR